MDSPRPGHNWREREKEVDSLDALVREVGELSRGDKTPFWFRGQSNREWGLEPSFLRLTGCLVEPQDAIDLESAALNEFSSRAHLYVESSLLQKLKTHPCWWAMMQHHGAPTRLLDWTASPYVAAYFAAQQDGSKMPGAIWCFCSGSLKETFEVEYGHRLPDFDKSEAECDGVKRLHERLRSLEAVQAVAPLTFPFFSSSRMANQQGRFTMCLRIHQNHDCLGTQVGSSNIKKILIPHDRKPDFLAGLRLMNITASALFPGVDGLGRSVTELASLGTKFRVACEGETYPQPGTQLS